MTKVEEIEKEIEALPQRDFKRLRNGFLKKIGINGTEKSKLISSREIEFVSKRGKRFKNYGKLKVI